MLNSDLDAPAGLRAPLGLAQGGTPGRARPPLSADARRGARFLLGIGLGVGLIASSALAATQVPVDADALLSEDEFGICVPEDQLDHIWLVYATKGKAGQVPHVCMSGDCEDLPDIAVWASAQQFPDDIDLERDDVVARYAAFVAEYCGPEDEVAEPQPEAVPSMSDPVLALGLPRLLGPGEIRPNVPQPVMSGIPRLTGTPGFFGGGGGTPSGGTPSGRNPPPLLPPITDPLVPLQPQDPGDPPVHTPPSTVPLPAGGWLLLSALGLGWLVRRRPLPR